MMVSWRGAAHLLGDQQGAARLEDPAHRADDVGGEPLLHRACGRRGHARRDALCLLAAPPRVRGRFGSVRSVGRSVGVARLIAARSTRGRARRRLWCDDDADDPGPRRPMAPTTGVVWMGGWAPRRGRRRRASRRRSSAVARRPRSRDDTAPSSRDSSPPPPSFVVAAARARRRALDGVRRREARLGGRARLEMTFRIRIWSLNNSEVTVPSTRS